MNSSDYWQLPPHMMHFLAQRLEPKTYLHGTILCYSGQVPLVAHVLISGELCLIDRKHQQFLNYGSMFGLKEMLEHRPFPFSAQISAQAKVYALDKSLVQEFILPDPRWSQVLQTQFDTLCAQYLTKVELDKRPRMSL